MNMRIPFPPPARHAAFAALFVLLTHSAGAAGLVEVTQTIFGMDCAPCAHGVQKNLMRLKGVEDATVSLNEGYAKVNLVDENTVTLQQIREVIRENGFTPKEAKLVITGKLSHAGNRPILTFADQEFRLVASPAAQAAWQNLERMASNVSVRIEGRIDESDATRIVVLGLETTE